ncbi:hypothetical protein DESC_300068 [Desulfosarcina cetonica]|uniref:flagellar export protein FliJ n=1 Tax=Desulfosarcina cetonica TaxID=90730 RepID=UPI0006CF9C09|nr:flagellar export protein FliJ [Desulfosarcina cetonica]VTR65272.1 hypothetical protein DESC_300068 [Desulfosarcina cetonica]
MYTFKLQVVLDHRQFLEDNLKKELAEIRQQAQAAKKVLEQMRNKEMQTIAELKDEQTKGLSSDFVVAYHTYLERLSERMINQQATIKKIEALIAKKQDGVLEAMKKRQILEKLKERGLERYNQTVSRSETNFINEIAINQYARKNLK